MSGYYYRVTWKSSIGSTVHSDGGPYPSHRDLLAAIGRVKDQVEEAQGSVLATKGWEAKATKEELAARQQLLDQHERSGDSADAGA